MNSIQQFLSSLPPALICLVIGASVAAESGLTVGMILPGTTALLLLGFFAHSTLVPLPAALITAIVAGLAGTSYAYLTGHRLGARARATRWGSWIGNDRWAQADEFFERRGALAVTVGQFVVGARTLVPRLAGMHGRRYSRFAAASVPAVLVWATGFTLAGYLAGASYQHVSASFGTATSALLVAVGTLTVLLLTGRWSPATACPSTPRSPPPLGCPCSEAGRADTAATCDASTPGSPRGLRWRSTCWPSSPSRSGWPR